MSKIGIFGSSGYGKSSLVKTLIRDRNRVIVFDTMDEYSDLMPSCDNAEALRRALAARWYANSMRVAYVPPSGSEAAALHALCRFLIVCQQPFKLGTDQRPVALVIEEMDLSFPVTALAAELDGMPFVCNRGRHYGIELIGVSQYPAQVSTRFRANMDEVYSFMLPFEGHRQALRQQFGDRTDELARLDKYSFLHCRAGAVTDGSQTFRGGPPPARVLP